MNLKLDSKSKIPFWEQIVNQVKELILKGVLKPNDKLIPVRKLSSILEINPNTISKAYQELNRQGIIMTIPGKGTLKRTIHSTYKSPFKLICPSLTININSPHISYWKVSPYLLVISVYHVEQTLDT